MKRVIVGISALFMAFVTIQCGSDDDNGSTSTPSSSMTIDGTTKEASFVTASLMFEDQNDHEGRALQMAFKVGANTFTIGVSNWDFQNPPENGVKIKSYTNVFSEDNLDEAECLSLSGGSVALCDGALVTYIAGSQMYMSALYVGDYAGFVKITAIDGSAKKVSGEYDLKVDDGDGNQLTLKGKFENLSYIVIR